MIATARIMQTHNGPVLQILPMPANPEERALIDKIAELMPLRFRISRETQAALCMDAAEGSHEVICSWTKGATASPAPPPTR